MTTAAKYSKLQRYHKVSQALGEFCRTKWVDINPADCVAKLEPGEIRRIRPEERINQGVQFAVKSQVAVMEIPRWL